MGLGQGIDQGRGSPQSSQRAQSSEWEWRESAPSPWGFLRKDVILGELELREMQGCDSKGDTRLAASFTKERSIDYRICQ